MVLCNQCWYWIQKIYNFKKQCFEVEQSLSLYRQQHNLAVLNESHVEDFLKYKIANNFAAQDKRKISGITSCDNHRPKLISETVNEEPDDMQEIECLKFEADETVILNTDNNVENVLSSELNEESAVTEDDVFVEDCAVANATKGNFSVDSDTDSTELSIENYVADFTKEQRFGSSYQGHYIRYQEHLKLLCFI